MKRTLVILVLSTVTVVLLALVGAGIFLATLDLNAYKAHISSAAEAALGRKVVMEGNISHSLFPLGLRLDRVILADDGKYGSEPFVQASGVSLQTDLFGLLRGDLVVESILLDKLSLKLAIAANGTPNWEMAKENPGTSRQEGVTTLADEAKPAKPATSGQPALEGRINLLEVSEIAAIFMDFRDNSKYTASIQGLSLNNVGLGNTIPLKVSGTIKEDNDLRQADFTLAGSVQVKADGSVQANVSPLTTIISNPKVTANKLELALSANTLFAANTLAVNDLALEVAKVKATGLFSIILPGGANLEKGRTLDLRGELAVAEVDVDTLQASLAFLTPASKMGRAPQQGQGKTPVVAQGKNQAKQDDGLAALAAMDVNLALTVGKLVAGGVAAEKIQTRVALLGGDLNAPYSFGLSGGAVSGTLTGKLAKSPPSWRIQTEASGIQAGPLARTLTKKKGFDGIVAGKADISGNRLAWPDAAPDLNGTASMAMTMGYVPDVSFLPKEVTRAVNLPDGLRIDRASASFALKKGVAQTNDILVSSSLVTARGAGYINIPAENLELRIDVLPGGIPPAIPLIVDGSMYSPSVDLSARGLLENTARGIVETPKDAVKILEKAPKSIGKEIKGIFR